jgi:hypothetical protein
MPISKTWPSGGTNPTPTTYQIPLNTELNWTTLTTFLQALADSAQGTSFQKFALRRAVASPVAVVATTDCLVVTDLTVAGAVTVNLPAGADKQLYFIVDGKGDAGTNNITINRAGADTIRGATSIVIDRNYGGVILAYNAASTDWKAFGPFITPGGVIPADFVGILPTTKGGTGVNGTAVFPGSGTVAIYPISLTTDVSGILPVANGGTGIASLGAGVATFLGTPSSANLASAVTDETGSGALVFGTSPTITSAALVTPALGTPASGVMTNVTGLPLTTGVTGILPEANGGTGITSLGAGVATWLGTPSSANLAAALTDETGTGAAVFATSPTLVTPALGTPTSGILTNATGLPLTTGVTGTLPIGNGGTGQTTANTALNALLPSQTTSANKFLRTDGTNTLWATATGGAGEVNAVLNASGADGTTGWTGTTVVSGASSPLNPIITTAFSIVNAATPQTSTTGGYYPFTMPTGLQNKKLKVEFTFTTPATDIYQVSVYTGTTRVPLTTDASGVTALPASTTGKFTAYFDSDNSTSWTVGVTRTFGTTGACIITNVIVGPGIQPQGAVVGPWETPVVNPVLKYGTTTATNVSAYNIQFRKVGTTMDLRGAISFNGPANADGTIRLTLPNNLTINLTGGAAQAAAVNTRLFNSSNIYSGYSVAYDATHLSIQRADNTGTPLTDWYGSTTAGSNVPSGAALASGNSITLDISNINIAEWAGSGTVNVAQNDVEWVYPTGTVDANSASDGSATGYGPIGATWGAMTDLRDKYVKWQTPYQNGDVISIEISRDSGNSWGETTAPWVGNATSTSTAGAKLITTTANVTRFQVGRFAEVNPTAWSSSDRIRFKKTAAGAAVGFGIADTLSSGLVPSGTYNKSTTGWTLGVTGYTGAHIFNCAGIQVIGPAVSSYVKIGRTATQDWEIGSNNTGPGGTNGFYFYEGTGGKFVGGISTTGAWAIGDPANAAFPGNNIVGRKDGTTVAAGYVGERVAFDFLSPAIGTATTAINIYSKTLQAGVWLVFGGVSLFAGTTAIAGTDNYLLMSIGTTSATLNTANRSAFSGPPTGVSAERTAKITSAININSATTVYIVGSHNLTTTGDAGWSNNYGADVFAIRIA